MCTVSMGAKWAIGATTTTEKPVCSVVAGWIRKFTCALNWRRSCWMYQRWPTITNDGHYLWPRVAWLRRECETHITELPIGILHVAAMEAIWLRENYAAVKTRSTTNKKTVDDDGDGRRRQRWWAWQVIGVCVWFYADNLTMHGHGRHR